MNEFENYPELAERMEKLANCNISGWSMADWDEFCSAVNNSLVNATAKERARCVGIAQLAREGIVDQDFRSVKSVIASGESVESIRAGGEE